MNIRNVFLSIILLFFSMPSSFAMRGRPVDPFESPPIPLFHQINACYFNSVFQVLAVIPGLRDFIANNYNNEISNLFVDFLDSYYARSENIEKIKMDLVKAVFSFVRENKEGSLVLTGIILEEKGFNLPSYSIMQGVDFFMEALFMGITNEIIDEMKNAELILNKVGLSKERGQNRELFAVIKNTGRHFIAIVKRGNILYSIDDLFYKRPNKGIEIITDTLEDIIQEFRFSTEFYKIINTREEQEQIERRIVERNRPTERLSDLDLASAIENGDIEKAKKIIEMYKSGDLDLDFLNIGGSRSTPLMWAAYINDKSIIESLIDLGANVELKDRDGNRALDFLDESDPNYEYNRKLLMTESEIAIEIQEREERESYKQQELRRIQEQKRDRALQEQREKERQERLEQQKRRELRERRKQEKERQERERIKRLPHNRLFNIIMSSHKFSSIENEEYILKTRSLGDLISKMSRDYPSRERFLRTLSRLDTTEQEEILENLKKKTKEERVYHINRRVRRIRRDRSRLIDFLVKELASVFKISSYPLKNAIRKAYRKRDKSEFFRLILRHLIEIKELNNLNTAEREEFVKKFRKEIRRR